MMLSLPTISWCALPLKSSAAVVGAAVPVNPLLPKAGYSRISGGVLVLSRGTGFNSPAANSADSSSVNTTLVETESAADTVKRFYAGFNDRDLAALEDVISQDCTYEDLVFPQPFVGRKAILDFFKKFMDLTSRELQFVIDDISEKDESAVGVTWHLEWRGKAFPFSKGCSFYRFSVIDGHRQIIYGRDSVEPTVKPGDAALFAIGAITRLLENFPSLADLL